MDANLVGGGVQKICFMMHRCRPPASVYARSVSRICYEYFVVVGTYGSSKKSEYSKFENVYR
jgi:hypothetical protein